MMKKKYRIGLVGFAHMHVLDQIKPFLAMPERVEWIGAGYEANGGIRIL
ncbi:MAG: hypothetical protein ACLTOZ_08865 [[Clostridium] leptum]